MRINSKMLELLGFTPLNLPAEVDTSFKLKVGVLI